MSENRDALAAASAILGEAENDHRELLASVVTVARALFGAAASSVFLLDEESHELVFEAVAGEGESHLVGRRFPADRGIAGWVLAAGEPLVVSDLSTHPTFARDLAESTGYVPSSLMAAPLVRRDGETIGVMEVLDASPSQVSPLSAAELLTLFAGQAAIALGVVRRSRQARRMLSREGAEMSELAQVARLLDSLGEDRRAAGMELLDSVNRLLRAGS
jgi:GAF domain-containing protein